MAAGKVSTITNSETTRTMSLIGAMTTIFGKKTRKNLYTKTMPMMSNSRFTMLPGTMVLKLVCSWV